MSSPPPKIEKTSAVNPCKTMRGHTEYVLSVVHLPGGQRIITCSLDGSLRLWDLESGTQIGGEWQDEECEEGVLTIALSPNGKTIASGSIDGTVRLWDIEMRKVVLKWKGHSEFVTSLCWSPNGERVVSGSWDETARVWDVKSGEPVQGLNPIKTGYGWVYAVSYSPQAKMIATGGYNEHGIEIWDANTGELLSTIKLDWPVCSLAWTSNEKKLIAGSNDASIRIFDTATWQQIAVLEGHADVVYSITLFQNDRLLASTSWDKTARLWNLDTNLQVGPPLQHENFVWHAAFSADGKLLSTACYDNNAYVWDIQTILDTAGIEDLLDKVHASSHGSSSEEHISRSSLAIGDRSFLDADATRGFGHVSELSPKFFDNKQANARSSAILSARAKFSTLPGHFPSLFHRARHRPTTETQHPPAPSESRSRALFNRLRSPLNISSHVVDVSAIRDREVIFVAPPRRPETASEIAKRVKNPKPWVRVVFFLCCVSPGTDDSPGANDTPRGT